MRAAEPRISDVDLITEIYLGLASKAPRIAASVTVTTFQSLSEFKKELLIKTNSYNNMVEIRKTSKKESRKEKVMPKKDEEGKFLASKKKLKPSELSNSHSCSPCKEDHID